MKYFKLVNSRNIIEINYYQILIEYKVYFSFKYNIQDGDLTGMQLMGKCNKGLLSMP